jgi:hypothetical protein
MCHLWLLLCLASTVVAVRIDDDAQAAHRVHALEALWHQKQQTLSNDDAGQGHADSVDDQSQEEEAEMQAESNSVTITYEKTNGYCRGGEKWSGGRLWDCSHGEKTVSDCKQACSSKKECKAIDTPMNDQSAQGECCLYQGGNTGDGEGGRWCYLKEEAQESTQDVELTAAQDGIDAGADVEVQAQESTRDEELKAAQEGIKAGAEVEVLSCKYESSVILSGSHQEPENVMTKEDLSEITGQSIEEVGKPDTQAVRVKTLMRLLDVAQRFAKQHLADVPMSIPYGNLIGVLRNGKYIPWDEDVDMWFNFDVDGAQEKIAAIKALPGNKAMHGKICEKSSEKECRGIPIPSELGSSNPVWLVLYPESLWDLVWSKKDEGGWLGRFVDVKTGYFVEFAPRTSEIGKECAFGGTKVNIAVDPFADLQGHLKTGVRTKKGEEAIMYFGAQKEHNVCQLCRGKMAPPTSNSDPFTNIFARALEDSSLAQSSNEDTDADDGSAVWTAAGMSVESLEDCKDVPPDTTQQFWVSPVCL